MATVSANVAINMEDNSVTYGELTVANSTTIRIEAGDSVGTYKGSFSYDIYGNVFGQVSSFTSVIDSQTASTVTGINRDAYTFFSMLGEGDAANVYVLSGADIFNGSNYNDRLYGYDGNDKVFGNGGADKLVGGEGNDVLKGGNGNDKLVGDAGLDNLYGGLGKDNLNGGSFYDNFIFLSAAEAGVGANADSIVGFDGVGDKINLREIDAKESVSGNQTFVFVGKAFSGEEGELRYFNGVVQGDTDGDKTPDFAIKILNSITLDSGDFIL